MWVLRCYTPVYVLPFLTLGPQISQQECEVHCSFRAMKYFILESENTTWRRRSPGMAFYGGPPGTCSTPSDPHYVPLSVQHSQRWSLWPPVSDGPERNLMMLFSLYDTRRGDPQVLNPSIIIVWTQLKVVGLGMLSAGQHLALLRPNLSIIRP